MTTRVTQGFRRILADPGSSAALRSTQAYRRTLASAAVADSAPRTTQAYRRILAVPEAQTRVTQALRRVLVTGLPCTTQRCQLWKITRTDGQVFAFTSHDRDVEFLGITFKACDSLNATAAQSAAAIGDVGDVSLSGIISDDSLSEEDLYGGLFEDAFCEVWLYDWAGTGVATRRIAAGWAGVTRHGETGVDISVLGPGARLEQQALVKPITPNCRFVFGSAQCGVDLEAIKLTGTVTASSGRDGFTASLSGGDGGLQWNNGSVLWTYGNNDGTLCEVKTVDFAPGVVGSVQLWKPAGLLIQPGDTFDLRPGCDKTFDGGCTLYANKDRFGGFPHMPGNDAMTETPNAKL